MKLSFIHVHTMSHIPFGTRAKRAHARQTLLHQTAWRFFVLFTILLYLFTRSNTPSQRVILQIVLQLLSKSDLQVKVSERIMVLISQCCWDRAKPKIGLLNEIIALCCDLSIEREIRSLLKRSRTDHLCGRRVCVPVLVMSMSHKDYRWIHISNVCYSFHS